LWVISQNGHELWGTRILLFVVALEAVISTLLPRLASPLRIELSYVPQLLVGIVALVVILNLRQTSQRKSLRDVSKALMDSIAYIERLEEYSFVDPETHTFHRSYLDHLFRQESQLSNRSGNMITMCLFEVWSDGKRSASEESVQSAASVLRSNFRGSDYIVRYADDQFLVLLSDTNEQQAEIALKRLMEKIEFWDLENDKASIMLQHEMICCRPGEDMWEKLRVMKDKLESSPVSWRGPAYLAGAPSVQPCAGS
jgi:diguanylate cyclase (GGDEF)-like protein